MSKAARKPQMCIGCGQMTRSTVGYCAANVECKRASERERYRLKMGTKGRGNRGLVVRVSAPPPLNFNSSMRLSNPDLSPEMRRRLELVNTIKAHRTALEAGRAT